MGTDRQKALKLIRAQDSQGPVADTRRRMDESPFLVGLAFPAQQGAWTFSYVPTATAWNWEYLCRLAGQADRAGLDHLFVGSQYFPPGGFAGRHRTHSLEAITLSAALATATKDICLIATFSALGEANPLYFSRLVSTLDHLSNGRIAINLMANPPFGDFGGKFSSLNTLEERYRVAEEFVVLAKRLWTEDEYIEHRGEYFDINRGYVSPKPLQKPFPLLMTADLIPASGAFAARHCNMIFLSPNSDVPALRAIAKKLRGDRPPLRTTGMLYVICRQTEREAMQFARHLMDNMDEGAILGFLQKFARTEDERVITRREVVFAGDRAFAPAIGTPEQIVERFLTLKKQGLDGVQMVFCDYEPELAFFSQNVMPLLRQAGLRG